MQRRARLAELAALALCLGCRHPRQDEPRPRAATSSASRPERLAAPIRAGRFDCAGGVCTQPYPRLPDTGEWRCADAGGVVWCAGGEPAAGIVPGPADPQYRCGARGGGKQLERVCIDRTPDYPENDRARHACSFAQEQGISRVCKAALVHHQQPLPQGALAACWLDADCRGGACDRGACRCSADRDCEAGQCRGGVCSEGS